LLPEKATIFTLNLVFFLFSNSFHSKKIFMGKLFSKLLNKDKFTYFAISLPCKQKNEEIYFHYLKTLKAIIIAAIRVVNAKRIFNNFGFVCIAMLPPISPPIAPPMATGIAIL